MNIILFDPQEVRDNLLPLTYTRPVADLRLGILTLAEKWQRLLPGDYSYSTPGYLSEKFPCKADAADAATLSIAGNVVADPSLAEAVASLQPGEALADREGRVIACRGEEMRRVSYEGDYMSINNVTDIFRLNGEVLRADFAALTAGRESAAIDPTVTVIGDREQLFVEPGATLRGCTVNVTNGPVYIGQCAEVMECAALRGPIAVCEHSVVNMGARIYADTTIGPWSKVGGELNNVVIHSYSNKAHDGFLGNAVIGAWCNLGAGCTASNLKNDYTEIKLWNYPSHRFLRTGLQFCGLIMGDHSKAGINTMFNTATVVGVGVNIHGAGFPRNFVASFSDGGNAGFTDVSMSKFFDTAQRMMARRSVELTDADRAMFMAIREAAESYK